MPAVTRKGDKCSGHDSYKPRPSAEGSPDVYVNGKPVHRVDDEWEDHGHSGPPKKLEEGSTTVYANGKAVGRLGDPVECGSVVAQGSPNVFIEDKPVSIELVDGEFIYTEPFAYSYRAARPLINVTSSNGPYDEPVDEGLKQEAIDKEEYPPEEPAAEPEEDVEPEDEEVQEIEDGCPVVDDPSNPYSIPIGNNGLTVRSLTLSPVFPHRLQAQKGFTIPEIVCNLHHLALNCLDPIMSAFPTLRINSGFRRGSGGSQHCNGMACDLQASSGGTREFYREVLEFISKNCPYDQCIIESANGGRTYWIHISFDRKKAAQRKQRLTYLAGRSPAYTNGWQI